MDINALLQLLAAIIVAAIGYWVRSIDQRVQALENDTREIKALRVVIEKHVEDEENIWKRLENMERRTEDRHVRICERLVAVETLIGKGGGK